MAYSQKFKTALAYVLASEGGNDDDPRDEGGRTGQGITQTEYTAWLKLKDKPLKDVWQMTPAERDAIYFEKYWTAVKGDQLPLPIAYMAFDACVLHGVGFAPKALQQAVGVRVDGFIGPVTIAAAKAQDPMVAWGRLREARWARMKSRKSFPDFAKGWTKRLNDCEKNVKELVRVG